jgi:hypothetical protein
VWRQHKGEEETDGGGGAGTSERIMKWWNKMEKEWMNSEKKNARKKEKKTDTSRFGSNALPRTYAWTVITPSGAAGAVSPAAAAAAAAAADAAGSGVHATFCASMYACRSLHFNPLRFWFTSVHSSCEVSLLPPDSRTRVLGKSSIKSLESSFFVSLRRFTGLQNVGNGEWRDAEG